MLAVRAGVWISTLTAVLIASLIPEMHDQTSLGTSVLQFVGVTGAFAAMAALLLCE